MGKHMTSVMHERSAGGYPAQATHSPENAGHMSLECQNELTPEQKFAKNAVLRFFNWLEESPNNPSYTSSPTYLKAHNWLATHRTALEADIATRQANFSYDHLDYDSAVLQRLSQGAQRQQWNELKGHNVAEPMMFAASEISHAGIEEVLSRSRRHEVYATPEDDIEDINTDIVRAIGAQIVRLNYFEYISNERPRALPKEKLAGFENAYKQNIVSDIHRAALINEQVARTTQEAEHITNVVPIKKAA